MRYINLLDSTSRVKTSKCFIYNNAIVFAVPSFMVARAIGPGAINVRNIQEKLDKKIRIISEAKGLEDAGRFIQDIVAPVTFKSLEIKDNFLIINSGHHSKAALIGRNKRRYEELRQIIKDTFSMELKII